MGDRLAAVGSVLRALPGSVTERVSVRPRARAFVRQHHSLAEVILFISLPLILIFLIVTRPPIPFYALPLAPIALAAVLYEFTGGTLGAVAAMAAVGAIIALDPDAVRRARTLQEAWPILIVYLAAGPLAGWLAAHERGRERQLVLAARQLRVAQEIAKAINTSLDRERILQTIMAETRRLAPFQQAAVLLREGDFLRVVAASEGVRGVEALMGRVFPVQKSAAGLVVRLGQVWLGGPSDVALYPDLRVLCPPDVSCAIVPLKYKRAVIGVLALAGRGLDQLPQAELDNLNQVTDQMAIAIEHARLFQLQRARSRALAAISDASREIAASLNLDRTLRLVMGKAAETLPMDAGALFIFDEASQLYRVAVSHNLSPAHVAKITFGFEEGVPGWVVKNRQPLIIPDAARDERVHPYVIEDEIKSVLATPMVVHERVVGVLNLYGKAEVNAFDDEALRLAQVYADQTAVFIENARLVDELRRAAAELEARVERRTQQLRQTQAQVIRAEKLAAVGRLAGSVAHEVNNPLQAIALHLQLVVEEDLSEPAQEEMAIVQQELARIAGIVQRLLDFERPKPGLHTRHDVWELLHDVLALAGKQVQQANVTVIEEGDKTLLPVLAVGDQLKQVFLNLVLNAVEAMPDGGELRLHVAQVDDMIEISFADTGVGMTPEVTERLFEPFFSTKHGGTGLGLAVSHEIISQHGGCLEARSVPGRGATFTVSLPVLRQAAGQTAEEFSDEF